MFQHSTVAHANPSDAGIALSYVISQCVSGFPAQGGLAKNGGRWALQALALTNNELSPMLMMAVQEAMVILGSGS